MTKNSLIKRLQEIKGNPEIVIWNGYVGDYNHLGEVSEEYLYKECPENLISLANIQRKSLKKGPISKEEEDHIRNKESDWEFPNRFFNEEQIQEHYNEKKMVVIIDMKPRNKSTFDRLGEVLY